MNRNKQKNKGYTFLELLVVVAIIAVISMIALPAYQDYITRGRRSEARNSIMDLQQKLEQNYTLHRTWEVQKVNADGTKSGITADEALTKFYGSMVKDSGGKKAILLPEGATAAAADYALRFDYVPNKTDPKVIDGTIITAVPINKQQNMDKECQTFILKNNGAKIASKTRYWTQTEFGSDTSRTGTSLNCWKN